MDWNINSYPKFVKIGAHEIKVKVTGEYLEKEGKTTYIGAYYPTTKEIHCTHKDDSPTTYAENFLHEVVEATNDINDLQLTHQTITTLASTLYQALSSGEVNFGTNVVGNGGA